MTELRAGRKLSQRPGACTLYLVTPGDDREADVCIGSVASAELAGLIVAAVNGAPPASPRCPTPCDLDCGQGCHETHVPVWKRAHDPVTCVGELVAAERGRAARGERFRIAALLRSLVPSEFLERHGLQLGAGAAPVLSAAATEIEEAAP